MTEPRRRKSRYSSTITLRVRPSVKAAIEALADEMEGDVAQAARRVLDFGLAELDGAEDVNSQARDWWSGLDRNERKRWGRRLGHLEGAAFVEEAWRQAWRRS